MATLERKKENEENLHETRILFMFMMGFILAFAGIIVLLISTLLSGQNRGSVGVVIFIGPFPIVVGTGQNALLLIIATAVLVIMSVILLLLFRTKERGEGYSSFSSLP